MPRYLVPRLHSEKRHTAHRTEGGYKDEGIFYEEVVTTHGLFAGLFHRLPSPAADAGEEGRGGRPLADRTQRATRPSPSPSQERRSCPRRAIPLPAACRCSPIRR